MDTDGDGVTDVIETGRDNFLLFRHEPGSGWHDPDVIGRNSDLDEFPDITFGDRGVQLADMTGDGLQDFVAVRSADVSYWPYLGHGAWGKRVQMLNPPRFPPGYRDDRLFVVDIDGDGCSDILYMDAERTFIWFNQCGTGFADPVEIPLAPPGHKKVLPVDFLGDGRVGFAWSAAPVSAEGSGYRFLRFDAGRAPYLMTAIDNGMGRRTEMIYATSTDMRLRDRADGKEWLGELPMVLSLISEIRDHDTVMDTLSGLSIRYHDGVYDGPSREFRGFSTVTVDTSGDESIPTLRQEYTFYQGVPERIDLVERERDRALAGSLQILKTFAQVATGFELRESSQQTWQTRLEHSDDRHRVLFPFISRIETQEHSPTNEARRMEITRLEDYDAHGNAGKRIRECFFEGDPPQKVIRTEERFAYTANQTDWLVRLPVRHEMRDGEGMPCTIKVYHYDGAAFEGLPEGQATRGLLSRTQELVLLEQRLPAGYIGGRDLEADGYRIAGSGDTRGYYAVTFAVSRDAKGNIVEQRNPVGASATIQYEADGLYPIRSTDERGMATQMSFDPKSGEPSRVVLPDEQQLRYEYDSLGRLRARFAHDDAGQEQLMECWVLDTASVPVSTTSVSPQQPGRVLADIMGAADLAAVPGVFVSRKYYGGFGEPVQEVSTAPDTPDGLARFTARRRARLNPRKTSKAEYSPAFVANLDFTPLPPLELADIRRRFDARGFMLEVAGPGPVHFRIVRDNTTLRHYEGESAGAFGAETLTDPPTRIEHFDARDRVVRIEEAVSAGTTIATEYDLTVDGRIEKIRTAVGETVQYTYAGPDEAIRIRHRDLGARTYYRDAAGRLIEMIAVDGSRLSYRYDPAGRLMRIEHTLAGSAQRTLIREIFYDADPVQPSAGRFLQGRIALVREEGREFCYSYDRAGRKTREEVTSAGSTLVVSMKYDLQGEVTELTYPDGHQLAQSLDASGAIQKIPGVLSSVSYSADGALAGYALANGVTVTLLQDAASRRLTEATARKGASVLRRLAYTYDAIGNVTALLDEMPGDIEHCAFSYDGLYRLSRFNVRRSNSNGAVLRQGAYAYDAEGNLRQFGDTATVSMSFDDTARPGRLTSVTRGTGTLPVGYDARGNTQAFGGLGAISFDPLDRIARLVRTDGTEVRLAYDPQGQRVLKEITENGATRRIRYAGNLYEESTTKATRHIYLGDRLIASETTSGGAAAAVSHYHLADHQGTLLMTTDSGGAVVGQQRYSPFGTVLIVVSSVDRYIGRERDPETGLIQFGQRYYAAGIGRFISPDWYVLENPNKPMRIPQGFNPYSYAVNNPIVLKDPSAKWLFLVPFVVGFVGGLIYGVADGKGWKAFGTGLETALTTGFGSLLGFVVGGAFGGVMGGLNGLFAGTREIYEWGHIQGWASFLSDSSWGLVGTSLGNFANVFNLVFAPSSYRGDLSQRQNRQVYDRGFSTGGTITLGNVTSSLQVSVNQAQKFTGRNASDLEREILKHETVHILQNRLFGPLYPTVYIAWFVGGGIIGGIIGIFTSQNYGQSLLDVAYLDNPFEYWAFNAVKDPVGGEEKGKLAY